MSSLLEWMNPATWACLALASVAVAVGSGETRRGLRLAGALSLLAGCVALLAALAVPELLPAGSAVLRGDGSTDDPRVLSALLAAAAAICALLPAWRSLRLKPLAACGLTLPGIALGALTGSLAYFAGLHAPMALAALCLGALAMGTALTLAIRRPREAGGPGLPLQGFGAGVLVVAGVLSLHGARATGLTLTEGVPADTLGMRVELLRVESPRKGLRVIRVELRGANDSLQVSPRFEGEEGRSWRPMPDGSLLRGPIAIPLTLRQQRSPAHEIQWVAKQDSLRAGAALIRFTGFRIEHKDSIRMFADLEVTTAAGTEKVAPGVTATPKGERPFPAMAHGFGPIAVARFDPDNHRVGLMLPELAGVQAKHEFVLDLRLRPALPFAWAGAALALVGFVLALLVGGTARRTA